MSIPATALNPVAATAGLLRSPADHFLDIIEASGLTGAGTIWSGYVGGFGEQDVAVCCFDLPGRKPEVAMAIDYPGLQVIVRGSRDGSSYGICYDQAVKLFNLLQTIPQHPSAYPDLVSCTARTSPAHLGKDENSRHMFSLNFDLITTPAVSGNRT